jgi:hypothetical protein
MNNKIYELTDAFDFNLVKLENPSLISGNNYYSKINNATKNNLYIQLPKCNTKQGIVNNNNKCFCDLEFFSNNKQVIEFFENLESHCVKEICANKELWFYDSKNITDEDIQEYVVPIMRSYKSGKKFLIKTSIKQDKIIIYDENEKKITLEEYDKVNDIVPLININGIKFSKSSFIIDIILIQFMILYPCDNFENQILIKLNKPISKLDNSCPSNNELNNELNNKLSNELNNDYDTCSHIDGTNDVDSLSEPESDECSINEEDTLNTTTQKTCVNGENVFSTIRESLISTKEEDIFRTKNEATFSINSQVNNEEKEEKAEKAEKAEIAEKEDKEDKEKKAQLATQDNLDNNPIIEICDLDNIIINSDPIEIKTHDTIYLEIYNKAKQTAKEIRRNAIQAFLEAKNIKIKYNLNAIDDSSSDEEYK